MGNILRVAEEVVLLLTNLNGAATELSRRKYVSVKLQALAAKPDTRKDIRYARCDMRVASENNWSTQHT